MAVGDIPIGSVGNLIGAAMQTTGEYLQSEMIDVLLGGLGKSLGFFLFVAGATGALFLYATTGHYKTGKAFLLGVPIAFTLLTFRIPATGANWEFGQRTYPSANVDAAALGVMEQSSDGRPAIPSEPAQISFFFAIFDKIVSSTVQTFIAGIQLVSQRAELTMISKIERFQQVMNLQTRDPKLKAFIQLAVVNRCADYYQMKAEYYSPATNTLRQQDLQQQIAIRGQSPVYSNEDLVQFRDSLQILGIQDDIQRIATPGPNGGYTLTCDQLWTIAIEAYRRHSVSLIDEIAGANLPPGMTKEMALDQLNEKFNSSINHIDGNIEVLNTNARMILMINEVAGRMLLRELRTPNDKLLGVNFAQHKGLEKRTADGLGNDVARTIRNYQKTDEFEEKGDYLMAILALPYVQGLLLYFLAMSFPFFALVMIAPGHQKALFLWAGLWIWAKSWDFGFAVVMLIDDILYALMPHGTPLESQVLADPGLAIKILMEVDPTYSVHTYYNLLSTCLAAVPILTGMALRRGGGEVLERVGKSLSTFSGRIGEAMAFYSRALHAESMVGRYAQNMFGAGERAYAKALRDPQAMSAFATAGAAKIASNMAGMGGFGVGAGMQGLLDADAEKRDRIFSAKTKQLFAQGLYNEGVDRNNRLLGQEAIMMKYWAHDFFGALYPSSEILATMQAEQSSNVARGVASGVAGGASAVGTALGAAGIPGGAGGLWLYQYTTSTIEASDRERQQRSGQSGPTVNPPVQPTQNPGGR